jgi:hypothetical protein
MCIPHLLCLYYCCCCCCSGNDEQFASAEALISRMETKADEAIAQSVIDTAAGIKGPYPGAKFSSHHICRWQQGTNEPDNAWAAKHVRLQQAV